MIIEVKNFLSPEEIEQVRSHFTEINEFSVGQYYNRQGDTVFVSGNKNFEAADDQLYHIFCRVLTDVIAPLLVIDFPISDSGYEFHRYGKGDICELHTDGLFILSPGEGSTVRLATAVIHLTDDESELHFPNQRTQVKTEAGKLILFSPDEFHSHYSTPVTGSKEIIMTWFTYGGITVFKDSN